MSTADEILFQSKVKIRLWYILHRFRGDFMNYLDKFIPSDSYDNSDLQSYNGIKEQGFNSWTEEHFITCSTKNKIFQEIIMHFFDEIYIPGLFNEMYVS